MTRNKVYETIMNFLIIFIFLTVFALLSSCGKSGGSAALSTADPSVSPNPIVSPTKGAFSKWTNTVSSGWNLDMTYIDVGTFGSIASVKFIYPIGHNDCECHVSAFNSITKQFTTTSCEGFPVPWGGCSLGSFVGTFSYQEDSTNTLSLCSNGSCQTYN
jgi:hypothetical protein